LLVAVIGESLVSVSTVVSTLDLVVSTVLRITGAWMVI